MLEKSREIPVKNAGKMGENLQKNVGKMLKNFS